MNRVRHHRTGVSSLAARRPVLRQRRIRPAGKIHLVRVSPGCSCRQSLPYVVLLKRGLFAGPVVKLLPLRLNLLYYWQKDGAIIARLSYVTTPPDKSGGFPLDLSAASYETPEQSFYVDS